MTMDPSHMSTVQERPRSTRRRFIAQAGAIGLTAAATMMVRADPALATYRCGCCNLYYPNGHSLNWCLYAGDWLWYCNYGNRHCTCCEAYWAHGSDSNCC
jgi:hypothetical protein